MDKWGRRRLLLLTFPLMAICLFVIAGLTTMATTEVGGTQSNSTQEAAHLTAMRFYAREADNNTNTTPSTTGTGVVAGVVVAMYVYCIIYSVGEGPVPFVSAPWLRIALNLCSDHFRDFQVYASESMPLQHRDAGRWTLLSHPILTNVVLFTNRHGCCDIHQLELQLSSWYDVAIAGKTVQTSGGLLLLRWLVRLWMVPGVYVSEAFSLGSAPSPYPQSVLPR